MPHLRQYGILGVLIACAAPFSFAHAQTSPVVVGAERLAEAAGDASISEGRVLLSELGCASCHEFGDALQIAEHSGPDLRNVGVRVSPSYLSKWLAAPHEIKPGTTMPDLLTGIDANVREETIEGLVHYLASEDGPFQPDEIRSPGDDDLKHGEELFHSIGCVACHAPRREPSARIGGNDEFSEQIVAHEEIRLPSVPLPNLRAKTNHDSLTKFLFDPHAIRRAGRMPNMKLSPDEAKAIASYLLSDEGRENSPPAIPFTIQKERVDRGSETFTKLRCVSCHVAERGIQNAPPRTTVEDLSAGCLSSLPIPAVPWYGLSDRQRRSVRLALRQKEQPDERTKLTEQLAALNCFACHDRNGVGGIEVGRRPYFSAMFEADLGDEGRIPPTLTGVGAKLTEKGLSSMLLADGSVRPYMATRMPQFETTRVGNLPEAFLRLDKNPDAPKMDVSGLLHHHRNLYGRQLMGTDGLGCISCHTLYGAKSLGIPALDLATIPDRIQPSWFKQYMLDPSELRPGTRMPAFFEDGKSAITRVLSGNADQQIEAMWIYLREIDQTRLPVGMEDRENFELVPSDRPILLRTFMKGVGTHAIAVGYPQGVHVAFDALNVRLALGWRGKFIDAESTWADRFSPLAKPLSEELFTFPSGMPFSKTNTRSDVEGSDAGYRFRGYRLDDEGIPTFLYTLKTSGEAIEIEETIDVSDEGSIVRKFAVSGNHATSLYLRPQTEDDRPTLIPASTESTHVEQVWKPTW
jgi:mono/diheme cytochrome c family protein